VAFQPNQYSLVRRRGQTPQSRQAQHNSSLRDVLLESSSLFQALLDYHLPVTPMRRQMCQMRDLVISNSSSSSKTHPGGKRNFVLILGRFLHPSQIQNSFHDLAPISSRLGLPTCQFITISLSASLSRCSRFSFEITMQQSHIPHPINKQSSDGKVQYNFLQLHCLSSLEKQFES
jgi:hypothetical protein